MNEGLPLPALLEVPDCLSVKSKHDVRPIKNCDPVHIIPKSDYRPNQNQYPVKPKAVEGI